MLTKDEIVRRLRALLAMPPALRPVTLYELAELACLERKRLYYIAGLEKPPGFTWDIGAKGMQDSTQASLSRVFEWIEAGRVSSEKTRRPFMKKAPLRVLPEGVQPCVQMRRIKFDADGFRIERVYVNPLSFPKQ